MKGSHKQLKRSVSPLIPKTIEISQRKQKSVSNPYAKVIKEFQTYGKQDKKRNYKEISKDRDNKYRIVTQPVDDRILHLAKGNIFNTSFKMTRSRKRLEQPQTLQPPLKFNLRSSTLSKQKLKNCNDCKNCQRYLQQLQFLKLQLNKLFLNKILWKNGQTTLNQVGIQLGLENHVGSQNKTNLKSVQAIMMETKKHFYDLMKDIQSLSNIDFPKMLSLDFFTYQPSYSSYSDHQFAEIKSLLGQLRSNIQGRVTQYDIQQIDINSRATGMLRNMKLRLTNCLRQNLQLRLTNALLSRSTEHSLDSDDYLKRIIENVLLSYNFKKTN